MHENISCAQVCLQYLNNSQYLTQKPTAAMNSLYEMFLTNCLTYYPALHLNIVLISCTPAQDRSELFGSLSAHLSEPVYVARRCMKIGLWAW